jgi:sodium/potassium-transporting ATPase subunit alpha
VSSIAIFLGVTFFIINLAMGADIITNLVFMIGIIVANVPEGTETTY